MSSTRDDRTLNPLTSAPTRSAGSGPVLSSVEGPTIGVDAVAPRMPPLAFTPGAIVAGRYRLVSLLGRGGMGEVYRADDLTLEQPVALKFLPAGVAASDSRLALFHQELRVARQVSHKNVCRLYDLGDADGRRFLTMEYVDGEDLSSSLRRFGRMPPDKAVQIGRQLCAAVAAAHEKGVLHRDLKPANVMLDGNGDVRITDFGIATAAADAGTELAGTPQYMAPELLAGKPASVKSDLYALGLILFEIFTGRRAYEATTIGELRALHETQAVTTPSAIVPDLDPAVERVILRCLQKDPEKRPASALTVAAALPGGDPLAAALAAGETPSPDMLAAAGETDALDLRWGVAAVSVAVLGILLFASLSGRTSIVGRVPLGKEPAVLVDRADEVLAALGYPERPRDRDHGLMVADDYIDWLRRTRVSPRRWEALSSASPSGVLFWYRTSPRAMVPVLDYDLDPENPPIATTGMRLLVLDMRGRLQEFRSVPPQRETADSVELRWSNLFDAAGLQMPAFSVVPSQWTPPDYADARMAWEGPLSDQPAMRVRVEAAAYRGKPVFFSIVGPWTRALRMNPDSATSDIDRLFGALIIGAVLVLIMAAALLARHNFRTGRADRRGGSRLVLFVIACWFAVWVVGAHHPGVVEGEFELLIVTAALWALIAIFMGLVYLALEPYVRRFWPDSLLGWSRLLAGHVRDPRVGRDVLIGVAFGVALGFVAIGKALVLPMFGYPAQYPTYGMAVNVLAGPGRLIAAWIAGSAGALENALITVLIFVVLRLLLRRAWLSIAVGIVLMSIASATQMGGAGTVLVWVFPILRGVLLTFVVVRFGLLPTVVTLYVSSMLTAVPFRLDMGHWAAFASNWTLAGLMALTLFGFYASRAGQPLFGDLARE